MYLKINTYFLVLLNIIVPVVYFKLYSDLLNLKKLAKNWLLPFLRHIRKKWPLTSLQKIIKIMLILQKLLKK